MMSIICFVCRFFAGNNVANLMNMSSSQRSIVSSDKSALTS